MRQTLVHPQRTTTGRNRRFLVASEREDDAEVLRVPARIVLALSLMHLWQRAATSALRHADRWMRMPDSGTDALDLR
ncbi:MAG: hypothetical protein BWY06_01012 [Candidatus Latescibacteria bacterium ADurb.Bin168]|nr:MAG: hypothetical protein BWY06_01012 [Candidatus Latescibacteria bacterium ADurb.Bin168]